MANRKKAATVETALEAFEALSASFGSREMADIARRALAAFRVAPGRSDGDKVAVLARVASDCGSDGDAHHILTAAQQFAYVFEPRQTGKARWRLASEAMAAAAKNTKLVDDVSKLEDPADALKELYVSRLKDPTLPLEDYPHVVEELLADSRLKADEQREIIMRVTGLSKKMLGNADNRRIALISWRRNKASDDYLFEARSHEKSRF